MQQTSNLPIGVFDSGMGGLTVLSALHSSLPQENFIYLGDTARLPYGTKTRETVIKYAEQAASALVARGIKALVVACNTASGIALPALQKRFAPLPVYGVIEPGAIAAVHAASTQAIGTSVVVLATETTISSGAYQKAIIKLAPQIRIFGRACPLWVTLAEMGNRDANLTRDILTHDIRGFLQKGPCVFLLGCTHFPVFSQALAEISTAVSVVDSAATTAGVVAEKLKTLDLLTDNLLTDDLPTDAKQGQTLYLATDGAARFKQVGGQFLKCTLDEVELVDL